MIRAGRSPARSLAPDHWPAWPLARL